MTGREVLQGLLDRAVRSRNAEKAEKYERELSGPPSPRALLYLWNTYHQIRRRMAPGMNGPSPIGWPDIDAFLRVSHRRLAPWEVSLIEDLDDLYLAYHAGRPPSHS